MKYIGVLAFVGVTISCNENNGLNKTENSVPSNSAQVASTDTGQQPTNDETACYMKVTGRDTAIVMLDQKGNDLSGQMLYDNFEKDGSSGIIKGKKNGDILKLLYDFNSEGTHSVMEVYFKEVAGGLLRGVGDMDVKGDTAYFRSGINYSDKEAFSKVDCSAEFLKSKVKSQK